MSLWTPSGEHRVPREDPKQPEQRPPETEPAEPAGPSPEAEGGDSLDDLSPEQRAQVEEINRQMEEARARMLAMPASSVVGQHALSFYELAALYLSQDPPRTTDAQLAIDALTAVVTSLGDRLGEAENPLRQALRQLQLAFVEATKDS